MFAQRRRRGYRGVTSGLLSVGVIGAILAMTLDVDLPSTGRAAMPATSAMGCGRATAATIASVDEAVAQRIYAGELSGTKVREDIAHVTGSTELLKALGSADQRAVFAAVHRLVYTPHWHIVRLRVLQHGRVMADIGGPDVIAPISGTLRLNGRAIGSFVMSVQDDRGYVKLVSRFIGVPIDVYRAGSFVMGTLEPPPVSVSDRQSLMIGESDYRSVVLSTAAFPAGTLKVALFVPTAAGTLASGSCASVRLAAWSDVAHHIAALFAPLSARYGDFRDLLQWLSGGWVFVRSGSVRLAGAGPARVPRQGTVEYRGRTWAISSWEAIPRGRIYFLTPTVAAA